MSMNLTSSQSVLSASVQLVITDMSKDLVYRAFQIILGTVLCGAMSMLGIVTNIITIMVLAKQANDNVNVVFLGLAISDLCCVITALWYSAACVIDKVNPPNFPYEPMSFLVMTAITPRILFVSSTCWLTALLAVVRCLSVTLPFKVNVMFVPNRMAAIAATIFLLVVSTYASAIYDRNGWLTIFIGSQNITKIVMVQKSHGVVFDELIYSYIYIFLPLLNLFIIVMCTVILVIKVKTSSRWRRNVQFPKSDIKEDKSKLFTNGKKDGHLKQGQEKVTKESRLTKMVITINSIFIVCNIPNNIVVVVRLFEPEFTERGAYRFIFIIIHAVMYLLETANSSVSLFVFYSMSSKFRSGLLGISAFRWLKHVAK
ncbi:hypothetical protein Btru_041719 [Bulinus truncatus]|nr:hypothetical protein Btru_041719 [Bulinus truncatus]